MKVYFNHIFLILFFLVPKIGHSSSDASLHRAILNKNIEEVKSLLSKGISAEQRDNKGRTPIFRASSRGNNEIIEILLDSGANVNATSSWGSTPIFGAVEEGEMSTIKLLIKNGAKMDVIDQHKRTPLFVAVKSYQPEIALFFLEKGADPNVWNRESHELSPLHHAAVRGYTQLITAMIEHGAEVNAKDENGITPLYMAAVFRKPECIKRLLDNGADINARNKRGETPLHAAVWNIHPYDIHETLHVLLEHGPDTSLRDKDGRTPFEYAKKNGHKQPILDLLSGKTSIVVVSSTPPEKKSTVGTSTNAVKPKNRDVSSQVKPILSPAKNSPEKVSDNVEKQTPSPSSSRNIPMLLSFALTFFVFLGVLIFIKRRPKE